MKEGRDGVDLSQQGSAPVTGRAEGKGDGLRRSAVTGAFWAGAQTWMVRLSTLVAFVILGRLLSPVEFGVVALAMTFISVMAVASDAGFSSWLIQRRGLTREASSTAFWISLLLGAALTGLLLITSRALSDVLNSAELRVILPALSVTMVIAGASSVPAALLRREMDFRTLALRQVVATLISVVVAVALAVAGAGVWALVAQHIVRVVVAGVILWAGSTFRPQWRFDAFQAREMIAYGVKSLGVHMGNALRDQGSNFLIGAVLGAASLGYWTVAKRLVDVVVDLCSSAVNSVAQPVFARLQDQAERRSFVFGRVSGANCLITAPAVVAVGLASRDLVPLLFGDQWALSADVAAVLSIAVLFTTLVSPHRALMLATDRAGTELLLTALGIAGQAAVILLLAGRGLMTVAVGLAVWAVVQYPLRALVLRFSLGIALRAHRQLLAVLLATGLASGAVTGTELLLELDGLRRVAVVFIVGGLVYLPMVFLVARPTVADVASSIFGLIGRRRGRTTPSAVEPVSTATPLLRTEPGDNASTSASRLVP